MPELVVPTAADAGRIAAVINERPLALGGETEESAAGVARWFAMPSLDPEADMRLAVTAAGGVEGYVDVAGPEDGTPTAWIDLRALPGSVEALGLLFVWAQERAAERVGPGGKLHVAHDEAFEDHWGYTPSSFEGWRAFNLGSAADTSLWRVAWDGSEIAGGLHQRSPPRRGRHRRLGRGARRPAPVAP